MPSRIRYVRTYTCALFLRNGDVDAYAVAHREWEQKSKPRESREITRWGQLTTPELTWPGRGGPVVAGAAPGAGGPGAR